MAQPLNPLRIPVRTESGQTLGHIVGVVIEPDTQAVVVYHVKPSRLVPDMVRSPLVIHRSQVISLTPEVMIVDDAITRTQKNKPTPEPVASV